MTQQLIDLCDFIHAAQKERGSVALYLRSQGLTFAEELEQQFAIVDAHAKVLSTLSRIRSSKAEFFLKALDYLPAKRKYITSRMIEPHEALAFYSGDIIMPAIELIHEIAVFDPQNDPAKVSAFINFLQWKERVGLERAIGTQLVNIDWSNITDLKARLEYIISEQQAYERMFMALIDDDSRHLVQNFKDNHVVFKKIDEINQELTRGIATPALQAITAQEWFALFTAKMDVLHDISRTLAKHLMDSAAGADESNAQQSESSALETDVKSRIGMLKTLPLFAGLNDLSLHDLLKHARIVHHAKGSHIFMQGEQATRFYIVLDGWVKLFKGNADGQESVLQVMRTGEPLLETVIFSNTPFPVNAQAVEQVTLLSIPASILRDRLQSNKQLAANMLSTVAGRSQALISQFEQLTLKTVTQRVGWFLLKLFLESGTNSTTLKLPYDKSLIAGFLGMKPETFSRALQTLKDQGIDIDRNAISLPGVFALCDYCDMELSAQCARAGTADCANPHCLN